MVLVPLTAVDRSTRSLLLVVAAQLWSVGQSPAPPPQQRASLNLHSFQVSFTVIRLSKLLWLRLVSMIARCCRRTTKFSNIPT